jgi:hypothetical protein
MRYHSLVIVLLFSFSSIGCGGSPAEESRPAVGSTANDEVEKNKAVVRRWTEEAHNKRNLAVVDEIYTADYPSSAQCDRKKRAMRILFLAANPMATSRLDIEEELRALESELCAPSMIRTC